MAHEPSSHANVDLSGDPANWTPEQIAANGEQHHLDHRGSRSAGSDAYIDENGILMHPDTQEESGSLDQAMAEMDAGIAASSSAETAEEKQQIMGGFVARAESLGGTGKHAGAVRGQGAGITAGVVSAAPTTAVAAEARETGTSVGNQQTAVVAPTARNQVPGTAPGVTAGVGTAGAGAEAREPGATGGNQQNASGDKGAETAFAGSKGGKSGGWGATLGTMAGVALAASDWVMVAGVVAAPFTGGASLALTGAAFAAKQGAKAVLKQAARKAIQTGSKKGLGGAFGKNLLKADSKFSIGGVAKRGWKAISGADGKGGLLKRSGRALKTVGRTAVRAVRTVAKRAVRVVDNIVRAVAKAAAIYVGAMASAASSGADVGGSRWQVQCFGGRKEYRCHEKAGNRPDWNGGCPGFGNRSAGNEVPGQGRESGSGQGRGASERGRREG